MGPQQLIQDRVLIGISISDISPETFLDIAFELGMPADCRELLSPRMPQANAVFFGIEDRPDGSVCKVYLEFWDQVRHEVRRGIVTPMLLHFGVKWDTAQPGRHEVAHYTCYPLLTLREILRRIVLLYPEEGVDSACDVALNIMRLGAKRNPAASFLYLESSERDNPRCSFDVNLYKSGLCISDVSPELRQAARHFGIPGEELEVQFQRLGHCPLGHLSGGTDRHGREFLSVYGETMRL